MAIYAVKLTEAIGAQGPAIMMLYLVISGVFLTVLRKPVAQMVGIIWIPIFVYSNFNSLTFIKTVDEQRNEGEFRHINARLITNCEEVAFYQGHKREEINIMHSFNRLVNHFRNFILFRFSMGFIDNIVAKCKQNHSSQINNCNLILFFIFQIRFCHIYWIQCCIEAFL